MTACIIGWAHTPFGRLETETVESLIVRAATAAMEDAGIAPGEVDEILLGHFNAGFSPRISPHRWSCRPRRTCASSGPRGWRMPAPPAPPRFITACAPSRRGRRGSCSWSGSNR